MKKNYCIGILIIGLATFGAIGILHATSIDIEYNGFCDGVHLDYAVATDSTLTSPLAVSGYRTGCAPGETMAGVQAFKILGQGSSGMVLGYDDGQFPQVTVTVIRGDGS